MIVEERKRDSRCLVVVRNFFELPRRRRRSFCHEQTLYFRGSANHLDLQVKNCIAILNVNYFMKDAVWPSGLKLLRCELELCKGCGFERRFIPSFFVSKFGGIRSQTFQHFGGQTAPLSFSVFSCFVLSGQPFYLK